MATDIQGKVLFTGSADSNIKSWNIATGQLLRVTGITCPNLYRLIKRGSEAK